MNMINIKAGDLLKAKHDVCLPSHVNNSGVFFDYLLINDCAIVLDISSNIITMFAKNKVVKFDCSMCSLEDYFVCHPLAEN